jgi:hypothetical protein
MVATLLSVVCGWNMASAVNSAGAQEREGGRSAEGEQGPRRSAEGEQGPRRSAEGEQGPRRSAEGERDRAMESLRGFQPQNQREAALLQMIMQLQREVASLRQEVRSRGGSEGQRMEGEPRREVRVREGDTPRDREQVSVTRFRDFELPPNWQRTKEGQVFLAYDKNRDNIVSLDEWLAMTNGNINAQRRQISTGHFNEAEPSGDGKFTPAEFIWWRQVGSRQAAEGQQRGARDGEGQRRGARDGEGQQRGARDGEGQQRGARDGEGQQRGARDGEGQQRGARDGEGQQRGARDGEGQQRGARDGEGQQRGARDGARR